MHRRTLLLSGGLAVTGALAGCASDSPSSDEEADPETDDRTATPEPRPPQASWTFEYDSPSEVLTITHAGGDTATAAEIYVVGTGIIDPDGSDPDITQSDTNWASATGESEVDAGKSVTVGLEEDSGIDLVWRSPGGGTSAVISKYDAW